VIEPKIKAYAQIFQSRPELAHFFKLNLTASASPRSALTRESTHCNSSGVKKLSDFDDVLSGNERRKAYPKNEIKQVNYKLLIVVAIEGTRVWIATYDALNDKDPAPSTVVGYAIHLHETEGENTSEGRRNASDQVKGGVSFAHLITLVPSRHEVNNTWEESCLREYQCQ